MTSESSRSMAHSAPSANSAGSPNADYDYADEPLPPKGQQSQSWFQSTVNVFRDLWTMPADLQARLAKAKASVDSPDFSLFGFNLLAKTPSAKRQAAIKTYKDAARQFLAAKDKVEAGNAYEAAALLELEELEIDDPPMDVQKTFEEAHRAYFDVRPLDSARCQQQIIKLHMRDGNYGAAADPSDHLGDFYMQQLNDPDKAIEAWLEAANWHKHSRKIAYGPFETSRIAVRTYKKVAQAYAKQGNYYKAIEAWEWCVDTYPNGDNFTKSTQTVGFFLNAGLCHVATGDTVALSRAIQHYVDLDSSFRSTRECKFLLNLLNAMEAGDENQFELVKKLYNQSGPAIPEDKLALLNEGKKRIEEAADNFA